jgi:hypothetical protein
MLRKDPLAVGVLLAEPHSSHTGALKTKVKTPNTREEAANRQHPFALRWFHNQYWVARFSISSDDPNNRPNSSYRKPVFGSTNARCFAC